MPAYRFRKFWAGAVCAIALAAIVQPVTSHAYTPEQQQACSPDAMRLCGEFVPNVDAITACMIQKKSQLSPQCRAFFRPGPEPGEAAGGQPVNVKPVAKKRTSGKPAAKKTTASSKSGKKKPKADDT